MVIGYALLWLETLAAALLWTALVTAFASRLARGWLRVIVVILVALVPLFGIALHLSMLTGMLRFMADLKANWFAFTLSESIAVLGGSALLGWFALRRAGDAPRARAWQR